MVQVNNTQNPDPWPKATKLDSWKHCENNYTASPALLKDGQAIQQKGKKKVVFI